MKLIEQWIDRLSERRVRQVAQQTSRRSAVAKIGTLLVGGAILPMLPFDRSGGVAHAQHGGEGGAEGGKNDDPQSCDYWRNCAIDGFLCTCCGGTVSSCPPGSEASKVTWVGTCKNPKDGKDYLVSYSDCCGKTACARCLCNYNERERPGYRMGVHNDINWCMADKQTMYHCTLSVIVGVSQG
ncbi:MAG: amine dehydrogenase [Betaproteobacteria bacterium]|nr:amine dehydrogenase [Betaproteobacteria bacterium]